MQTVLCESCGRMSAERAVNENNDKMTSGSKARIHRQAGLPVEERLCARKPTWNIGLDRIMERRGAE